MASFGVPQLEGTKSYKRDDADSDDEAKPREKAAKQNDMVLQLSSLKIHAPAEGFLVLREVYLTRSGASDADVDKIAWVCQGLTTLDCSGCPRIGDRGCEHLIPRMAKDSASGNQRQQQGGHGGSKASALRGCPMLKNVYFHGTSVTDIGIRAIIASKLVSSLKIIGLSDHVTPARCNEIKSRGIKCTGGSSSGSGVTAAASGGAGGQQVSVFESILPAAFANALFGPSDPQWLDDLGAFFKFATCWPED